MNPNLENKIMKLIYSKKEDSYYDFKKTRIKKDKLLKDIISLANCKHDGDRYLIFGVDDNFQVIGLEKGYTQSDLHDFLDKKLFAGENVPNIKLETIFSKKNKRIDVIIIKNEPHKPYYLIEKQNGEEQTNLTNIIWTRHKDKNSIAYYDEVKEMWEEQLGLTGDSMKRFKNYLKDFKNWKNHSDDLKYTYYYNPESNYHILGEIELSPLERKEEPFSLFYLDDKFDMSKAFFKVNGIDLECCHVVHCDGTKFPVPDVEFLDSNFANVPFDGFYYYLLDSLKGLFAQMLSPFESRVFEFPYIFFNNKEEMCAFSKFLKDFDEKIEVPKDYYPIGSLTAFESRIYRNIDLDSLRRNKYIHEYYYKLK